MNVRTCQRCGCTDTLACFDPILGIPCHWVGPAHCSVCFDERGQNRLCTEHMPTHPAVAVQFTETTPEHCYICQLIRGTP
jgi:hypothetical protein